jgi:hypothetical protein
MRCPVHVVQDMKPVFVQEALYKKSKGRGLTLDEAGEQDARPRSVIIFRCLVENCSRVDYEIAVKEQVRSCPICKKPSDAPSYRAVISDYRCKRCLGRRTRERRRIRDSERRNI